MASETWDPNSDTFPSLASLPSIANAPKHASWFWGPDDNLGRINLLTPTRVKAAASEIKTGELVRTDLPLNIPAQPAFGRQVFKHEIKALRPGYAYDDTYELNTQSGTQFDGFRHVADPETGYFYNWTTAKDIAGDEGERNEKCGMHHWAAHGFAGRGVLLDYRSYATAHGISYDSATSHAITYADLVAVGRHQGLDIRPASQGGDMQIGDVLFVRSGFVQDYYSRSSSANEALGLRQYAPSGEPDMIQCWAGLSAEEEVRTWLHDCYFVAGLGDSPTWEAFPPPSKGALHGFMLACWGMPIGEMLDLEKVSEVCKRQKRWTFFFTAGSPNCPGGVGGHVNGTAVF